MLVVKKLERKGKREILSRKLMMERSLLALILCSFALVCALEFVCFSGTAEARFFSASSLPIDDHDFNPSTWTNDSIKFECQI